MSESTRNTADGGESDTLDVEDLFATDETDISIEDGESDDETVTPGSGTVSPDAEDTTAEELFAQLRAEQDDADQAHAVDDFGDETPDEIMARADEEEEHVDQIDDSIRADEGALDDLLLTERREADGFLWVETEEDAAGGPADDVGSLFAPEDGSSTEEESDQASADASNTDASAAEGSDDDFSLTDDSAGSFDARAATFDTEADDFAVDATAFDDDDEDASTGPSEDASTGPSEDASLDGDDDQNDATAHQNDADHVDGNDPESTGDDEQESDDDEGLASRIRSILTG
jgi:hypothetical protein